MDASKNLQIRTALKPLIDAFKPAEKESIKETMISSMLYQLQESNISDIERAVNEAIRTCKTMPKISNLLALMPRQEVIKYNPDNISFPAPPEPCNSTWPDFDKQQCDKCFREMASTETCYQEYLHFCQFVVKYLTIEQTADINRIRRNRNQWEMRKSIRDSETGLLIECKTSQDIARQIEKNRTYSENNSGIIEQRAQQSQRMFVRKLNDF